MHLESFLQTQTTSETAGKRKINIYFSEFETRHVEYYSNRTTYNSCFLLGEKRTSKLYLLQISGRADFKNADKKAHEERLCAIFHAKIQ